jgi:hypothetical protein
MTAGFLRAIESPDVVTKAIDVGQRTSREETFNLGEVAESRSGKGVGVIQRPRNLAGIERNTYFVLGG